MRSARPFPVTTPMRLTISWTTIRRRARGMKVQRIAVPQSAPAME
jgi:hypothetical protein